MPTATSASGGLIQNTDGQPKVSVSPALETLPLLAAEASGPFDLIFIDADKESTAEYFRWALKLSRRGSLIVVDNVVREGTLIDEDRRDAHIQGIRDFYALAAVEPRVNMTAIQTVGIKGYDGFAVALVAAEAAQQYASSLLPQPKLARNSGPARAISS